MVDSLGMESKSKEIDDKSKKAEPMCDAPKPGVR